MSRLAQAEQQCSTLQAQLTAAEAAAQATASAAAEEADRIPALEHQLRRGEAKLAAANSQMSALQARLTEASRQLAEGSSAQARLESELAFSNSELDTACAAAQQHAAELPDSNRRDRMQQQRDADMCAVRAEAQAQQTRLKSELASSQAAVASLHDRFDAADLEHQRNQAKWRADMSETQNHAAIELDTSHKR